MHVQVWTGPESSRRLKLPDFKTIGGEVVSPMHRLPLPLKYTLLLEAESTPGPQCG